MNEYWGYGLEWEEPSPGDKRIMKKIEKALNIKIRQAKGRRLKKQDKVRVIKNGKVFVRSYPYNGDDK